MYQEVPKGFFSALSDHGEGQGSVIGDRPFQRGLVQEEKALGGYVFFAPGTWVSPHRQLDFAMSFQCEQEIPAARSFNQPLGCFQSHCRQKGLGDGGAAPGPVLLDAFPDGLEVFRADLPASEGVKRLGQNSISS